MFNFVTKHKRLVQIAFVLLIVPPFAFFGPGSDAPMQADDVIVIDLEWAGPGGYWLELRRCFSFGASCWSR